jgi:uncharacterized protein
MIGNKVIKKILTDYHVIAVVGASNNRRKASNRVFRHLKKKGYEVMPVNPNEEKIMGEKSYHNLTEIRKPVDIIDIFLPSTMVYPIVEQAVRIKPKVIWMQLGIENERAKVLAESYGIKVIMNRCILAEHKRIFGK